MYSKQEKLAAARKKLKEFQGKQRENDLNKEKSGISPIGYANCNCSSPNTSANLTSHYKDQTSFADDKNFVDPKTTDSLDLPVSGNESLPSISRRGIDSLNTAEFDCAAIPKFKCNSNIPQTAVFETPVNSDFNRDMSIFNYGECQGEVNNPQSDYVNGPVNSEAMKERNENESKPDICTFFKDSTGSFLTDTDFNPNCVTQGEQCFVLGNSTNDVWGVGYNSGMVTGISSGTPLLNAKTLTPTSQLAEEKNNLMTVLKRTEEILKYKTDEVQSMVENASMQYEKIQELEKSLISSKNEVQDLRLKNSQMIKQKDIDNEIINKLQKKLDSTEEQTSELQQKFELKMKENEFLSLKLHETQNQLSASLIKIQQLTVDESSSFSANVSDIQNENSSLRQKIQELEKCVDVLSKEKEESSLNFHTYAQQCNSEIHSLSSEVRNLVKENQLLREKNETLERNINDVNRVKEQVVTKDDSQIIQLSSQLEDLSEENKQLNNQLKERLDDIKSLRMENSEKANELTQVYDTLQELKKDNLKLLEEREDNKSNQKLLAAMESDKVAAARAVSQNQKLKDQVVELEEAFIKLSHEKMQLTDELANEIRKKKELEVRLKELELHHCHETQHKPSDPTINESGDVVELKSIIRQLENDKTELISRLNSSNMQKVSSFSIEKEEHMHKDSGCEHGEHSHNEESEDSKLLLHQMEEKVKKTMNEIAALDEEKEKLEHLVLQLQGETETIGEYIFLYQTQRMLLRQRNKEKDDQLLQLAKDKEELKSKLSTLNDLVNHLLTEKGIDCATLSEVGGTLDKSSAGEITEETAVKIQTLISEIQSTNLIDNQSVAFEHCPCCSGRLITV